MLPRPLLRRVRALEAKIEPSPTPPGCLFFPKEVWEAGEDALHVWACEEAKKYGSGPGGFVLMPEWNQPEKTSCETDRI